MAFHGPCNVLSKAVQIFRFISVLLNSTIASFSQKHPKILCMVTWFITATCRYSSWSKQQSEIKANQLQFLLTSCNLFKSQSTYNATFLFNCQGWIMSPKGLSDRNLWGMLKRDLLQTGCHSSFPTNSVKALKAVLKFSHVQSNWRSEKVWHSLDYSLPDHRQEEQSTTDGTNVNCMPWIIYRSAAP